MQSCDESCGATPAQRRTWSGGFFQRSVRHAVLALALCGAAGILENVCTDSAHASAPDARFTPVEESVDLIVLETIVDRGKVIRQTLHFLLWNEEVGRYSIVASRSYTRETQHPARISGGFECRFLDTRRGYKGISPYRVIHGRGFIKIETVHDPDAVPIPPPIDDAQLRWQLRPPATERVPVPDPRFP